MDADYELKIMEMGLVYCMGGYELVKLDVQGRSQNSFSDGVCNCRL